jgi:hypothetical protein
MKLYENFATEICHPQDDLMSYFYINMDFFCSGVAVENLLMGYEAVSMGNQIPTFR